MFGFGLVFVSNFGDSPYCHIRKHVAGNRDVLAIRFRRERANQAFREPGRNMESEMLARASA